MTAGERRARPWLSRRHALPGTVALLVLMLAVYVLPKAARSPVMETAAWGALVLVSFLGYGSLVRQAISRRAPVDVGLRATWGAALACILGGGLAAASLMTRAAALGIVNLGVLLAFASLFLERDAVARGGRFMRRVARREWLIALLGLAALGFLLLQYFAAICDWHTNPYDDDIAYLPFVKKLEDTGALDEPFSLRRLSALGGQTFFLELLAPRTAFEQSHTFDRGVALVMVALLIFGYRAKGRRAPLLAVFGATLFVLVLPSIAINTGSYYSGVVFFFGLYRTLEHLHAHPPSSPLRAAVPLALLSATACSLRQNFVPVPAVILGVSYAVTLARSPLPWRARWREPVATAGLTLLFVAPWLYVSYRSNGTFLYPVMLGDANPSLTLEATTMNWFREIQMQVRGFIEIVPIRTLPFLFIAAILQREESSRRPLLALLVGTVVGTALCTHAFSQSDPSNVARYGFGFTMALALAALLGAATQRELRGAKRVNRASVALLFAAFAVSTEIVLAQDGLRASVTRSFRNIDDARAAARRTPRGEAPLYDRLQASVPEGARLAVMLDEPFYLDFARNPVWNLDMPGYASLPGRAVFPGS